MPHHQIADKQRTRAGRGLPGIAPFARHRVIKFGNNSSLNAWPPADDFRKISGQLPDGQLRAAGGLCDNAGRHSTLPCILIALVRPRVSWRLKRMAPETKFRHLIGPRTVGFPPAARIVALALVGLLCAVSCSNDGDTNRAPSSSICSATRISRPEMPWTSTKSPSALVTTRSPRQRGDLHNKRQRGRAGARDGLHRGQRHSVDAIVPNPQGDLALAWARHPRRSPSPS